MPFEVLYLHILLVRPRKLIARCAILSHEPKITEVALVSSPPRSPPSEGFHLATTFSIPALLNPIINKMADEVFAILLSGSNRPMIGPRPCAYACAYIDPVFTSQSYDVSKSTSSRRTNLSVFLMPMLISTQFSLAYTCACAYAYALVKTRL